MLNVDPIISQEYVPSMPALGYLPPVSSLHSLADCVMCIVFIFHQSSRKKLETQWGEKKKSLIVSIAEQLQVGETASLVSCDIW